MKKLLLINGGNTHIECCYVPLDQAYDGNFSFEEKEKYIYCLPEFLDQYEVLANSCIVAASSVVPRLTDFLREKGAFLVSKEEKLPFKTDHLDISTTGADRMANAGALLAGKLPAVSIDFGTAITFEVVEEDGNFTGGAILPGRKLLRHALHDHTALLPLIPLVKKQEELPERAGKNTVEAMMLGTDLACIGAVREVLDFLTEDLKRKSPGKTVRVCACGGDCDFFLEAMPHLEKTPFLTLEGTYIFWKTHLTQKGEKQA